MQNHCVVSIVILMSHELNGNCPGKYKNRQKTSILLIVSLIWIVNFLKIIVKLHKLYKHSLHAYDILSQ